MSKVGHATSSNEPDDMSPRQREISDRIAGRRGDVRGPFQVWLHSPDLCDRVEALRFYTRVKTVAVHYG